MYIIISILSSLQRRSFMKTFKLIKKTKRRKLITHDKKIWNNKL